MTTFDRFSNQQYLNLETFRKNGVSVKTPVWFVQEGEMLFVRTVANSGKVKRIRNRPQVNIAPCKGNGDLLGEWMAAQARELTDAASERKVNRLLNQKYGLVKKMFDLFSRLQGKNGAILEIKRS